MKKKSIKVLVTGLSGSGKSTVLRALEDINFYCVDNLPVPLIKEFLGETKKLKKIVIGIDIRSLEYTKKFRRAFEEIKELYPNIKLIFTDAFDEVLERRFSVTRRPHPLSEKYPLNEAIKKERKYLKEIKELSDIYIDTSNLNIHNLRAKVINLFEPNTYEEKFNITLMSFGYSYGLPQNSDLIFDLRFLDNPYFKPNLKDLTGEDERVQKYLHRQKNYRVFLDKIIKLLRFYIPQVKKELRFSFTIGVGCTGGMHRSVVFAIDLKNALEKMGYNVILIHRDIRRGEL